MSNHVMCNVYYYILSFLYVVRAILYYILFLDLLPICTEASVRMFFILFSSPWSFWFNLCIHQIQIRNSSNLFVVSFFHLLTMICCFVALNTFVASVHFAVHLPSGGLACTPQDFLTSCSTFQVVRSTCMLGILNHECLLQF